VTESLVAGDVDLFSKLTADIKPFLKSAGDMDIFSKSTGDIKPFLKSTGDMDLFSKSIDNIKPFLKSTGDMNFFLNRQATCTFVKVDKRHQGVPLKGRSAPISSTHSWRPALLPSFVGVI
jgi:hypothetical protein